MTPTEFALWLNGALGVMGDAPTGEQMAKIREKLGETIGQLTADRLLERAEEAARLDKTRRDWEKELNFLRAQMAEQAAKVRAAPAGPSIPPVLELPESPTLDSLGSLLRPAAKATPTA